MINDKMILNEIELLSYIVMLCFKVITYLLCFHESIPQFKSYDYFTFSTLDLLLSMTFRAEIVVLTFHIVTTNNAPQKSC